MAVKPGGSEADAIHRLALTLQSRGPSAGIPGLGNPGDEAAAGWEKIARQVFANRRKDLKRNSWLAYLTHQGQYAQSTNGRNPLARQGPGPGQSQINRRNGLPVTQPYHPPLPY